MSRYAHLPIFQKSYDLTIRFFQETHNFSREHKFTIGQKIKDILFYGGMEFGEYEIRGSYLLGEMTEEEWNKVVQEKSDVLTRERFRKSLNGIAITQGIYTKIDSPLFVQTWYGRMMMQFGRWRITNAMLVRRITKGAVKEVKKGMYGGPNMRRVIRMIIMYGIMMYMGWELGKRGYDKGKKIAQAGAELINNIFGIISGKMLYDAFARNPTIQIFGDFVYTVEMLAHYIGVADKPYPIEIKRTIDQVYIAALATLGLREKKKEEPSLKFPALPKFPDMPKFPKLPAFPKMPTF